MADVRMTVDVYAGDDAALAEEVRVFLRAKVIEVMRKFPYRATGRIAPTPAKS